MNALYRVLGAPMVVPDPGRALGQPLLSALGERYMGLKFLEVSIDVQSDMGIANWPKRDLILVAFSVSGSAADLERHRFGDPSWWTGIDTGRSRQRLCTPGLGEAYCVFANKNGYRISGARYDDGLDRLLPLFMPALLEPFQRQVQ